MKNIKGNLIKRPLLKSLLALAIPIIFANILQTAYQLVDTFWVGRLGATAIAAVSLSFPILFLVISLGIGLTIAGAILVAHHKGRNDKKSINYISAQTILLSLIVSIILMVLGLIISAPLIKFMGAESFVFPDAVSYLRISFLGIIFLFVYFAFQSLMRGVGDVKIPMYIVLGTVLLNLVLDPLFILGYGPIPGLGVKGAAIATVSTQGLAALIGVCMLFSGKYGIHLKKKNFKIDFRLLKKLFRLGFPASLEQVTVSLSLVVMTFLVAGFGTPIIASYGLGSRFLSFIIIPALGLSMATSTLVGQNIGAGKIKRAEEVSKISAIIAFISLTIVGVVVFIFANYLVRFFIPDDLMVAGISASFVKIMALTFGFVGVQKVLSGTFRGSGNTIMSMILAIVYVGVLRLPLAYILSKYTSLAYMGLWWAFPITNIVIVIVSIILFLNGSWKGKKVTRAGKLIDETEEEVVIEEGL